MWGSYFSGNWKDKHGDNQSKAGDRRRSLKLMRKGHVALPGKSQLNHRGKGWKESNRQGWKRILCLSLNLNLTDGKRIVLRDRRSTFYTVFISYVNYGLNTFMRLSYKLILVTHLPHPFSWILLSVWKKDLPLVITIWFFKFCLESQCFMKTQNSI